MKKFDGILFCTDIDGTLFTSDKTVSKQNLDAIEYFKSEGGLFTFITGRVPKTSEEICKTINPNAPFGCFNGGGIYDQRAKKYLWSVSLPEEVIELVSCVYEQLPEIGIQVNTENNVYFIKDNSAMVNFRAVTGLPNITCQFESLTETVLKIVFAHEEDEQILKLASLLNSHPKAPDYDFIRSERTLYEILPKGISKGVALCKMADLLGIDKNRTIAVGDYNNDVSMIKAAKLGFAVSNAVDEAKSVADYITVSNNESAIAVIIDGLDRRVYRFD